MPANEVIPMPPEEIVPLSVVEPKFKLDMLVIKMMDICDNPFFLSLGFNRIGLPEIMMCNLVANPSSSALFGTLLGKLQQLVCEAQDNDSTVPRLLTSTKFSEIKLELSQVGEDQKVHKTPISGAIRKLDDHEERLLLAQIFEFGMSENELFELQDTQEIPKFGVCIFELADENNILPGQPGYNQSRSSAINTVEVLH